MENGWGKGRQPFLEETIREFDRRIRDSLACDESPGYTVEPVVGGLAAGLLYECGALTRATLLEGQHAGKDITGNMRTILSIPLSLISLEGERPAPDRLQVWGLVYLEEHGCASDMGILDRVSVCLADTDLRTAARQPLNFFCYGVPSARGLAENLEVLTHFDTMLALQGWGLRVNKPHIRVFAGINEVLEHSHRLSQGNVEFPYAMAGVLITLNSLDLRIALEERTGDPPWAIAFMFP